MCFEWPDIVVLDIWVPTIYLMAGRGEDQVQGVDILYEHVL